MLVRAVVDVEESEDGNIYNIMFGHTALGSHAIDIFTTRGILSVMLIASRFVSSHIFSDAEFDGIASLRSTSGSSDTD